ncbi:MAG TPA: M48 family metallopeptidase, partial [Candidatus Polarisedimenticolia bacterium]|nr:M48 family metallopeptidase [Candidatus Polarisedimenticolia bacterium]
GPPRLVEHALDGVPPDTPRMEEYSHGGYLLVGISTVWSLLLLAIIVWAGLGAALQRWVRRLTRRPNVETALYAALFTVLVFVADLPIALYGHAREKRFGFATQTLGAWLGDEGKRLVVGMIFQALFFTLVYAVIRRLGRRWWIAGAAIGVLFLVLVLAIYPVFIAPLFNTFRPLPESPLKSSILALAHAHGIPAHEVYEMDASRQSRHNNAYVAGLLGTQRIVLYDTILKGFAPREILFVMGHEMGHYVLHHVWKTVGVLSLMLIAGFFIADRLTRRIIARRPGLGIGSLAEPASLPLLLLVLNLFVVVCNPALAAYSRYQEHAADRFGLEVTGDPEAAASSFIKFGRQDLGEYTVNPWIERLLYTHPSLGRRIRYAQHYAQAHPGARPSSVPPAR